MFYLMKHSIYIIYGYMANDMIIQGYSLQLAARHLLYAPSHKQNKTQAMAIRNPVV